MEIFWIKKLFIILILFNILSNENDIKIQIFFNFLKNIKKLLKLSFKIYENLIKKFIAKMENSFFSNGKVYKNWIKNFNLNLI